MKKFLLSLLFIFLAIGLSAPLPSFAAGEAFSIAKSAEALLVGNTSACALDLSWTLATGYTPSANFNVRRANLAPISLNSPVSYTIDKSLLTYTEVGLSANTKYYYDIQGIRNGNVRLESNPLFLTTDVLPSIPGAPTSISATANGGTSMQVNLSFATSSAESTKFANYGGYSLERRENAGAWTTLFSGHAVPIGNSFLFGDNNGGLYLNQGSSYEYRITLFETDFGCGVSARSLSPQVSIIIPSVPTGLFATPLPVAPNPTTHIALSWTAGTGQNYFEVWRRDAGSAWGTTPLVSPTTNLYDDTSIVPNVDYVYKVRACSTSGGCSNFTPEKTAVTGSAPRNLTTRITYATTTIADINLQWENTFPNDNYYIEQATSSGVFKRVDTVFGEPGEVFVSSTLSDVPLHEMYSYRVRSALSANPSNEMSVNLDLPLLIKGSAWAMASSTGIGWVSMNCGTQPNGCGTGPRYGVVVDRNNLISGIAWASVKDGHGYGWLSFNQQDLIGCPSNSGGTTVSSACSAKLDFITKKVSGWGKFISASAPWSGWVSLSSDNVIAIGEHNQSLVRGEEWMPYSPKRIWNTFMSEGSFSSVRGIGQKIGATSKEIGRIVSAYAQSATSYGIVYDDVNQKLSGEAWGGDITGWIAFSKSDCNGVAGGCVVSTEVINRPPHIERVWIEEGKISEYEPKRGGKIWCAEEPFYVVRWEYSDKDNDPQKNAEIVVYDASNVEKFRGTSPIITSPSGRVASSTSRYDYLNPLGYASSSNNYSLPGSVARNADFYVMVRASDGIDWSDNWGTSLTTTTPRYYYPFAQFAWDPAPAPINRTTQFSATSSVDRSLGVAPKSGWTYKWDFPHAIGVDTTVTTTIIFNQQAVAADRTTLLIKDGSNNSCSVYADNIINSSTSTTELKRKIKEQ
ncbi:MAG: hypothetical protein WCW78_02865 [Candidatus Paceibacterota bacterium]|jgi:hypothetical protein